MDLDLDPDWEGSFQGDETAEGEGEGEEDMQDRPMTEMTDAQEIGDAAAGVYASEPGSILGTPRSEVHSTMSVDKRTGMEKKVCELLGVPTVLTALVRPVSASDQRMKSLVSCALTLKIDGTRTVLLIGPNRVEAILHGENHVIQEGAFVADVDTVSVVDCELHHSKDIYAFDMLMFDNRDIRHRTLIERLDLMSRRIPASVHVKPYKLASTVDDAKVCAQSLLEQKTDEFDGIIVLNSTDPYWVPPLKWKEEITCDFLLESASNGDGFVLLSETTPQQSAARGQWTRGNSGYGDSTRQGKQQSERSSSSWQGNGHENAKTRRPVKLVPRVRKVQLKHNASHRGGWSQKDSASSSYQRGSATQGMPSMRPYLEVFREKGEIVHVRPSKATLEKLGIKGEIRRNDCLICECRRGKKGGWSLRNRRFDRKKPNATHVVKQNVQLAIDRCTTRSWLLRSLPLQNDFHLFLRWMEVAVRCCVMQNAQRQDKVVELGSISLRHFRQGSFGTLTMIEKSERRHDPRLLENPRFNGTASYSKDDLTGETTCDRLLSFFTVNDFFASADTLLNFVRTIAKAGPRSFSGLMWTASGGPVSVPGRYSLKLGAIPEAQTSQGTGTSPFYRFGQKLSLQLSAAEIVDTFVPDLEVLKSMMSDVDYAFRVMEEQPVASTMNGCPLSYSPLAAKLCAFAFVKV